MLQHGRVSVEDGDSRAHPDGDLGCVLAHDATTDDHHIGAGYPGHTAHQHTGSAAGTFEADRRGLGGEAPCHGRHWRQQRQTATVVGDGFVRNADRFARDQSVSLHWVRCEVEVGEEDLIPAQHRSFGGLWLFHFDHHVGGGEHARCVLGDVCAGRLIRRVIGADAVASAGLHRDLMAPAHQFVHAARGQPNASFRGLNLCRYSNMHAALPCAHCRESTLGTTARTMSRKNAPIHHQVHDMRVYASK